MIGGKPAYLLLLNKNLSTISIVTADVNAALSHRNTTTPTPSSRGSVSQSSIWFVQDPSTPEQRYEKAQECARAHYLWKIEFK